MKMYRVFLGLGSNVGSREKFIQHAVVELKRVRDTRIVWASSIYETDPYGKTDQPRFLNAALEMETCLTPRELYTEAKTIEQRIGRMITERWGAREIDIDILIYDGLVFRDDAVTVPHPGMEGRKFVLVPMKEIAPGLVHPVNGMTMEELVAACKDTGRVVQSHHKIILS